MNTIKFQEFCKEDPLWKGTDRESQALATSILEGENIWHRSFQVNTLKEWRDFLTMHGLNTGEHRIHFKGIDPELTLNEMSDNQDIGSVYFQYIVFDDNKGEHNKCIAFCCNCFIMNSEGQTIDSFVV